MTINIGVKYMNQLILKPLTLIAKNIWEFESSFVTVILCQ